MIRGSELNPLFLGIFFLIMEALNRGNILHSHFINILISACHGTFRSSYPQAYVAQNKQGKIVVARREKCSLKYTMGSVGKCYVLFGLVEFWVMLLL